MRNSQFAGETTVERGPCCAYADWENKWSKWSNVQETKLGEDESGKATRERWGGRRRQDYKGWGTGKPRIVLEVEHQPPHHFLLSDCILVFPSYLNNRFKKKPFEDYFAIANLDTGYLDKHIPRKVKMKPIPMIYSLDVTAWSPVFGLQ